MPGRRPLKTAADAPHRSACPINLSLEAFGDKWTLLIIRDMMFGGRRHFRELLQADEGIASNILADRLNKLVAEGIVTKAEDPTHKQKAIYSLTEKGIDLLPIFVTMGTWGRKHCPVSEMMNWRAEMLEKGGQSLIRELQTELRRTHLGQDAFPTPLGDYLRTGTSPRPRAMRGPRPPASRRRRP
jgi:DNA-binding HxlR family transcriptional regulator